MSTTSNAPQDSGGYERSSTPRWILVAFILVFALLGYALYAGYTSRGALQGQLDKANQRGELLSRQLDQSNERVAGMQGQLSVTAEKLGLTQQELARARSLAQTIRKEQKEADEQLIVKLGEQAQQNEARFGQVSGEISGAKNEIDATKKDLEATKGRLERVVGDMGVQSGLIARNREEVEEIKRLGERNIHEFDLRKTKDPQLVGPIRVRLKKADAKKFRYTLDVLADDRAIEKKDRTLYEPVQFYVGGRRTSPYEIVVFEISKDRIVGYLTTPKVVAAAQSQ